MALYKQDIVDVDLNTGNIFRSFMNHSIGFKDDDANRFGIRAFRDGEPVDLTGVSCQAVFMAPNGDNIALTSYGTVSGNVAYVTLPQACYDYEGQFCLAIKLVGGGVTGTVRIVDGTVTQTGASGTVTPRNAVPTYQEILAVYADMQEDIADYESVVANQNDQINSLKSALYEEHTTYRAAASQKIAKSITANQPIEITNSADAKIAYLSANGKNCVFDKYTNMSINSNGVVVTTSGSYWLWVASVKGGDVVSIMTDNVGDRFIYGFFDTIPMIGSVTIDNSQHTGENLANYVDGILVPWGAKYICFRTSVSATYAQCETGETHTAYTAPISSCGIELFSKNLAYGKLNNMSINASGVIVETESAYTLHYAPILDFDKVSIAVENSDTLVYGFFSSLPTLGSTTVNGSREVVSNTNNKYGISVPSGAKYIAFRSLGKTWGQCEAGNMCSDYTEPNHSSATVTSVTGWENLHTYYPLSYLVSDTSLNIELEYYVRTKDFVNDRTDYVTPQMFGAKADGVTDDTEAIQNAINFAYDNKVIEVYFPAGVYNITKPLYVWGIKNISLGQVNDDLVLGVKLRGAGQKIAIIKKTTNTIGTMNDHGYDTIVNLISSQYRDGKYSTHNREYDTSIYPHNIEIKDITFLGSAANKNKYGIFSYGYSYTKFDNVGVIHCEYGVYTHTFNCYNEYYRMKISDCDEGVSVYQQNVPTVTTMHFEKCSINSCGIGFHIKGFASIDDCSIDGGTQYAIKLEKTVMTVNLDLFSVVSCRYIHIEAPESAIAHVTGSKLIIKDSYIDCPNGKTMYTLVNGANLFLQNVQSRPNPTNLNNKSTKFIDCDGSSMFIVEGEVISNAFFAERTNVAYNFGFAKEAFNPDTDFHKIVRAKTNDNPPSLTATSESNEITCVFEQADGESGTNAIQFAESVDFTNYNYFIVDLSTEQSTESDSWDINLLYADQLYSDGYVPGDGESVGSVLRANGRDENLSGTLRKKRIVFNISNITGVKYVGLVFAGATGKRTITVYGGTMVN